MTFFEPNKPCPCGSGRFFGDCHGDLPWCRALSTVPVPGDERPLLKYALSCALRGNLSLSELLLQGHLAQMPNDADALMLMGEICLKASLLKEARGFFEKALGAVNNGSAARIRGTLELLKGYLDLETSRPDRPKYLLIKAWGYGFWSDVDHLLGQCLLAELTGRTPVVHWGTNSLFGDPSAENAFDLYFEPVSELTQEELARGGHSYYPPKWNHHTVRQENVNKWAGPFCRQSAFLLLGRQEDVVVSDFHTPVAHIMPWIGMSSSYRGMKWHEIYRHLFATYLKLKPHLCDRVEEFHRERMSGQSWLAVHVRGSDKVLEQRDLELLNREYYSVIDAYLGVRSDLKIFLMTDSTTYHDAFAARYGTRILSTDAIRTDGQQGVHLMGHSGKEVGEAVIYDTYLAAKCDFFLGNGGSNVSAAVGSLKNWDEGRFKLLGRDLRSKVNTSIYNW